MCYVFDFQYFKFSNPAILRNFLFLFCELKMYRNSNEKSNTVSAFGAIYLPVLFGRAYTNCITLIFRISNAASQ